MRVPIATCGLLVAVSLAAGCGGGSKVDKAGNEPGVKSVELVLANNDNGPRNIQPWVDAVEKLSGGSVRIRVVNNWRQGERDFEQGMIADVRRGKVALGTVGARAFDEVGVTSFQPLVAPLLVDSRSLELRVLRSDVTKRALAGVDKLGLVGLTLMPTELRRPFGIARALAGPDDFRAAAVYTREGVVARRTLSTLGATPARHSLDEWSTSVDGAELGPGAVRNNPSVARKAAGFTANVVLWPQPLAVVISRKAFDGLSDSQQDALRRAGAASLDRENQVVSGIGNEDVGVVCRLGTRLVNATPAELAGLRAAVQPVYQAIEDGAGNRDALETIRALKGDAKPETLSCPKSNPSAAGPGSQDRELEGTYRMAFSRKELETSPLLMDPGEINDENWGDFTLRFAHGRVALTQRNPKATFTTSGRYTTHGDAIEWQLDDIGETWAFRWSLYRGTLTLRRDKKLGVAPTPEVAKPWRRVD